MEGRSLLVSRYSSSVSAFRPSETRNEKRGTRNRNESLFFLRNVAARARGLHALEVLVPHLVLPRPVVIEQVPRVDARGVAIREVELHRVLSHRLDAGDLHVALA